MRTKDQGTLDAILKFVNKYYQKNRVAPTITDVAEGVGVARSTTHRYLQELSERGVLNYDRGILSAPESAKMKTASPESTPPRMITGVMSGRSASATMKTICLSSSAAAPLM